MGAFPAIVRIKATLVASYHVPSLEVPVVVVAELQNKR